MIENLFFLGKTGFKTSVFEKDFISYSCILFIKYYALRTFCIKLLYFSKKIDFSRISIEIVIKNLVWFYLFRSMLNRCWINRRHFQLIKSNFWSIENCIESFLTTLCFLTFITFSKLFKHFSLSLWLVKVSKQIFVVFPRFFCKFLFSKAGKTFIPFLFIYFLVSCIFVMHFGKISNLRKFGVFVDLILFF